MAGRNRPSFLKKQKEDQRRARATRKREERRARRQAAAQPEQEPEALEGALATGGADEAGEPSEENVAPRDGEEAGERAR